MKIIVDVGARMSNSKRPVISIIIRTKNEEKWITSCLKAVFDQDYKNFEVIIVDNNSSDHTLKRAKEFKVKTINIWSVTFFLSIWYIGLYFLIYR